LSASTLRAVNNLLVNIEGKIKGGISKLKNTYKLLVCVIGVNFFSATKKTAKKNIGDF